MRGRLSWFSWIMIGLVITVSMYASNRIYVETEKSGSLARERDALLSQLGTCTSELTRTKRIVRNLASNSSCAEIIQMNEILSEKLDRALHRLSKAESTSAAGNGGGSEGCENLKVQEQAMVTRLQSKIRIIAGADIPNVGPVDVMDTRQERPEGLAGELWDLEGQLVESLFKSHHSCKTPKKQIGGQCRGGMILPFFRLHGYTQRIQLDPKITDVIMDVQPERYALARPNHGGEMVIMFESEMDNWKRAASKLSKLSNWIGIPMHLGSCDRWTTSAASGAVDWGSIIPTGSLEALLESLPRRIVVRSLHISSRVENEEALDILVGAGWMLPKIRNIHVMNWQNVDALLYNTGFEWDAQGSKYKRKSSTYEPTGYNEHRSVWKKKSRSSSSNNNEPGCEGNELQSHNDTDMVNGQPCRITLEMQPYRSLGSALFQIAALWGISAHLGCIAYLPPDLSGSSLLSSLSITAPIYDASSKFTNPSEFRESNPFLFSEEVFQLPSSGDIILQGSFKSFRYSCNVREFLRSQLALQEEMAQTVDEYIKKTKDSFVAAGKSTPLSPVIAVHIRRIVANHQDVNLAAVSYIHKAMDYFIERYPSPVFMLVIGGKIENIFWAKRWIARPNIVVVDHTPAEAFHLGIIQRCNHVIVTAGAFGWWGAFLSKGIVVAWRQWTNDGQYSSLPGVFDSEGDYFPPDWIILDTPMQNSS